MSSLSPLHPRLKAQPPNRLKRIVGNEVRIQIRFTDVKIVPPTSLLHQAGPSLGTIFTPRLPWHFLVSPSILLGFDFFPPFPLTFHLFRFSIARSDAACSVTDAAARLRRSTHPLGSCVALSHTSLLVFCVAPPLTSPRRCVHDPGAHLPPGCVHGYATHCPLHSLRR